MEDDRKKKIAHYRKLLTTATDPQLRQVLVALVAEEESSLKRPETSEPGLARPPSDEALD